MSNPPQPRLTVVIPTYQRPEKARRALEYWVGKGFRILMLDGSDTPLDLPEAMRDHPDLVYLHRPEGLSARLMHAAAMVDTDYSCLCGDDEFLLPSALRESIDFLDRNPGYAACGGQTLGFSRGWTGRPRAFVKYEGFLGFDLNETTPRDRALRYLVGYLPASIYAVCRTTLWSQGMRLQGGRDFAVYAIGEILFEFLMAYGGGIRRLAVLHWLRSYETDRRQHQRKSGQDAWLSRNLTIQQVWQDDAHAALRAGIVAHVAATMAPWFDRPEDALARDFDDAITVYCRDQQRPRQGTALQRLRRKLGKRLDRWPLPFGLRAWMLRRQGIACAPGDLAEVLKRLS